MHIETRKKSKKTMKNHPGPATSLKFSDLAQNGSAPAETPPARARIATHMASPLEAYATYENDPQLSCLSARDTVQFLPMLGYLAGLATPTPRELHTGSAASAVRP